MLSRVTSQESCGFKVEIREKVHRTIFELMEAAATSVEDAPLGNPALALHGNCIMLAVWRLLPSKRDAIAPCLAAAITPAAQAASFLAEATSGTFRISSTPVARNRLSTRAAASTGQSMQDLACVSQGGCRRGQGCRAQHARAEPQAPHVRDGQRSDWLRSRTLPAYG